MAEPSKPIPSSKAFSNSAGAIATDFRKPKTSVNHNRMNRILRSSIVRRTNSSCLLRSGEALMGYILPSLRYGCVTKLAYKPSRQREVIGRRRSLPKARAETFAPGGYWRRLYSAVSTIPITRATVAASKPAAMIAAIP